MKARATIVSLPLFVLLACTPAPAPAVPAVPAAPVAPVEKRAAVQSLRVAQVGLPANMSPEAAASSRPLYAAMYDALTIMDRKQNVKPWAAESWSQPNDKTWRFVVRKDLAFSNGDKLSAADVAFTGNLMLETRMPQIGTFGNLTEVRLVDDTTVDFITKVPDASVLPAVAGLWIMPKKYYTEGGKAGFAAKPIGSGPYELVELRNADFARLKKRAAGHPYRKVEIAELSYRSITEQSQMVAGFKTGDIDVVVGQLTADTVESLTKAEAVVDFRQTSVVSGLFSQVENKERNTPLTDRRVRLALNYAVDKDSMVSLLYAKRAIATGQVTTPDSPAWDETVKPIPYDPATAKRLLAEAGYPNGFKLPIGIEFTPGFANPNVVAAIQSNLRDVGVEAAVSSIELAAFLDKFYGRNGQTKGDIFMTTTGDTNGFATGTWGYYTCNKPLVWWCNPDLDKYFELAAAEPLVAKRGPLMQKALAALGQEVALLQLLVVPEFVVSSPKIKGFVWEHTAFYQFDKAYRIE